MDDLIKKIEALPNGNRVFWSGSANGSETICDVPDLKALATRITALEAALRDARDRFTYICRVCADIRQGMRRDFPPTPGVIDNSFFVIADQAEQWLDDNKEGEK
jgi:hypothetical protein